MSMVPDVTISMPSSTWTQHSDNGCSPLSPALLQNFLAVYCQLSILPLPTVFEINMGGPGRVGCVELCPKNFLLESFLSLDVVCFYTMTENLLSSSPSCVMPCLSPKISSLTLPGFWLPHYRCGMIGRDSAMNYSICFYK